MALRTFRSNPALGGFGGESSAPLQRLLSSSTRNGGSRQHLSSTEHYTAVDCDAFAQIIKELVDNAVDACSASVGLDSSNLTSSSTKKRVRVSIERTETQAANQRGASASPTSTGDPTEKPETLRVTVSDNGCGMTDIQASVEAFRTSKAHEAAAATTEDNAPAPVQAQTAGRYGIGLTLCLLHAQRLVPNSCATIKSATPEASHYTLVTCVVDTEGDSVRCIRREQLPKSFAEESGTAVSVLVPGGATAGLAWPRLAEYFARFKLSLGLQCSLEVMAPSLSKIPLVVRPLHHQRRQTVAASPQNGPGQDSRPWIEGLEYTEDGEDGDALSHASHDKSVASTASQVDDERTRIWKATQLYLAYPLSIKNVAHSLVPIRIAGHDATQPSSPKLEVDLIVQGKDSHAVDLDLDDDDGSADAGCDNGSANMVLIRMVNRIPLLDGAEAIACGLVQGLAAKKRVWNSFGLDVTLHYDPSNITKLPIFQVRDSDQVAPFFQTGTHALYEEDEDDPDDPDGDNGSSDEEDGSDAGGDGAKRKRKRMRRILLPAKVRLSNIVVIVQIHAEPTTLPLPTLSKGRLPVDNLAIDTALEVGLTECLRQLQKSNPGLLLTASELRKAERDARYVPAVSSALASILLKTNGNDDILGRIRNWSTVADNEDESSSQTSDQPNRGTIQGLGSLIEERLRLVLTHGGKPTREESDSATEGGRYGSQELPRERDMDDLLEEYSAQGSADDAPNPPSSQDTLMRLTEM